MTKNDGIAVAKAMNTTVDTLRKGLEQKIFPFGGAVVTSEKAGKKSYSYLLYKNKVKEYLGIDLNDEIVQFD